MQIKVWWHMPLFSFVYYFDTQVIHSSIHTFITFAPDFLIAFPQ
jgi:hypothetical protein